MPGPSAALPPEGREVPEGQGARAGLAEREPRPGAGCIPAATAVQPVRGALVAGGPQHRGPQRQQRQADR
jgi:hypothetical protein